MQYKYIIINRDRKSYILCEFRIPDISIRVRDKEYVEYFDMYDWTCRQKGV